MDSATRSARDVRRLVRIPGIGETLATSLVDRGIRTKSQLRKIAAELPRETRVYLRYNVISQIPITIADTIVEELKARLVFVRGGHRRKYKVEAVGSIRRRSPVSKDIDLLVTVPDGTSLSGVLASAELRPAQTARLFFADTYASGPRRRSLIIGRRTANRPLYYAVDLFLATKTERPYALFHLSNGRRYNIRIRAYAKRKNWKLDQYGLFDADTGKRVPGSGRIRTERDLTAFLGVTYRPPEERTDA